jgi:hypothetical protein
MGNRGAIPAVLASAFLLGAVIFCALWLHERNRPAKVVFKEIPVEKLVVKEVPVEKLREVQVPVEKIKQVEVPVRLTDEQSNLIDLGTRMLNRPRLTNEALALYNIPAFRIAISLPDSFRDLISEEGVRTRLERTLKGGGIKIDESAPVRLELDVSALWEGGQKLSATETVTLKVYDWVTLARDGDLRSALMPVYMDGIYGYAGREKLEASVEKSVDQLAEEFINKYSFAQEKTPSPAKD